MRTEEDISTVASDSTTSTTSMYPTTLETEATSTSTISPTPIPTPPPKRTPPPEPKTAPEKQPPPHPSPTPTPVPSPTSPPATPEGPVYVNGFLDPRSITPTLVSDPSSLTVLVNKYFEVSSDYVPSLVEVISSKNCSIRPEAAEAWDLMREACSAATGKTLYLSSGYRSYETQKKLFEDALANKGLERAVSKYAYPGRSEHQLGLALDITTTDTKSISGSFLSTEAGMWMTDHAYEFGFILRYPSGKESITGYAFEAWHYRFVGVDVATAMYGTGLCYEEYLGI
mgnify:CR=1 FL=1